MLKLIFELIIILLIVYAVFYWIEPSWANRIVDAIAGVKPASATTTIAIPYSSNPQVYVNESLQTTSFSFSNSVVLHIGGQGDRIMVIMQTKNLPVLYVNMTGNSDALIIRNGIVVLNIWGASETITLYNVTLHSTSLHQRGECVYNGSANTSIYNCT